jgi:hypothetical protein
VALLPNVVTGHEATPLGINDPVVASIPRTLNVEGTKSREAISIDLFGLIVVVFYTTEALANGELDRVTVRGRASPVEYIRLKETSREALDPPPEAAEVDLSRLDERLIRDIEVTVLELEHWRVRVIRVGDVVPHWLIDESTEDPEEGEGIEVVGVGIHVS